MAAFIAVAAAVVACVPTDHSERVPEDTTAAAMQPETAPDTTPTHDVMGGVAEPERREAGVTADAVARRMLVDVQQVDSTIAVDARYATANNFTGAPLRGYEANRALLRREAADALARAQQRLRDGGLGLKVWDGYRPARASRHMVEWAEATGRTDLLNGWIARRSRHNLGLAVDATLIDLTTGVELDMGTDFDTFTREAHTANAAGQVRENRERLRQVLEREGFSNYFREWWHFDFRASNPVRFDLPIR